MEIQHTQKDVILQAPVLYSIVRRVTSYLSYAMQYIGKVYRSICLCNNQKKKFDLCRDFCIPNNLQEFWANKPCIKPV